MNRVIETMLDRYKSQNNEEIFIFWKKNCLFQHSVNYLPVNSMDIITETKRQMSTPIVSIQ